MFRYHVPQAMEILADTIRNPLFLNEEVRFLAFFLPCLAFSLS